MEKSQEILTSFLGAWKDEDYETMFNLSQKTWQQGRKVDNIKVLFQDVKLKDFNIFSYTYVSSAAMRFNVDLVLEGGKALSIINVICEEAPYKPKAWGDWGVNPISVQNVVQKIPDKKPAPKKKTTSKVKSNAKE